MAEYHARFEIDLHPGEALLAGTDRSDFSKVWSGDIVGTSRGLMASAGDPAAGAAGYVGLEVFEGTIGGRQGTLAFQQFGTMTSDGMHLSYAITPGSGTGELTGLLGEIELDASSGDHRVKLVVND